MFDENLYQETISALHASEDTLSEVMNMTHKTKRRGRLRTAAVLAAVNLTDELLKSQDAAENLRRQVKSYLDEAAQAKNEASELKRQLYKAQQQGRK